jgi:hypothetical protein
MVLPSDSASPICTFLLELCGTHDLRKMTIVEDNARSSGIVRQHRWYHPQSTTTLSSPFLPLSPLKRDSRWSSSSSSSSSTYSMERLKSPLMRKQLQHFVDSGLFEMDRRVSPETKTQTGEHNDSSAGGYSVLQGLRFQRQDDPGSPRLPTRREFIEEKQMIQWTGVQACSDEDDDHNHASHSRVATNDRYSSAQNEHDAKSVEEIDQTRIAGGNKTGDPSLKISKFSRVPNNHDPNLKYSATVRRIKTTPVIRSKSESQTTSNRQIAHQVRRILRERDVTTHYPSREALGLGDTILSPPIRRDSLLDEEEQDEKNACYDEMVSRRHVSGCHSW